MGDTNWTCMVFGSSLSCQYGDWLSFLFTIIHYMIVIAILGVGEIMFEFFVTLFFYAGVNGDKFCIAKREWWSLF